MRTLALVPVKELTTAKSRLASALSPQARRCLVLDLLDVVLTSLQGCKDVDGIVVVTSDDDIVARLAQRGVSSYRHPGRLNAALEAARADVRGRCERILVTLADLPLVCPDDFSAMHRLAQDHEVVVAPDRAGQGSNVMLLTPPDAIPFSYGPYSCQRHMQAAQRQRLRTVAYSSPTTGVDVDTPADLASLPPLFAERVHRWNQPDSGARAYQPCDSKRC